MVTRAPIWGCVGFSDVVPCLTMLFRRSFYFFLLGIVVGFWAGPVPAQVASITIRELTLTPQGEQFRSFAGMPQTFLPGEENHFVVNPPVDFVNRVAKVTAVAEFWMRTP